MSSSMRRSSPGAVSPAWASGATLSSLTVPPVDSRSPLGSHQVDHRKHRDPYNVEGMPEQAEAENSPENIVPEVLGEDLRHHCQEPEQARGHVKTVAANQREEGRQERTPARPGATLDETGELAGLEAEEGRPERESRAHGGVEPGRAARARCDTCETACEARDEKAGRLGSCV